MAFIARVGARNFPAAGDTIQVIPDLPIFDLDGAPLSNPFTVPAEGFYGFEPVDARQLTVYWVEGDRNLVEKARLKGRAFHTAGISVEGAITPGVKGRRSILFPSTIVGWKLVSDAAISIGVAGLTTVTGEGSCDVPLAAGSTLVFEVLTPTTATWATLTLLLEEE